MKKLCKNKYQWHIVIIVGFIVVLSFLSWIQFVTSVGNALLSHEAQNTSNTVVNNTNETAEANSVQNEKEDIVETQREKKTISSLVNTIDSIISTVDAKWSVYKKGDLSKIDSILTYYGTREISSVQVINGDNKWLFYKSKADGDTIADYEGTNKYKEKELQTITQAALLAQSKIENMGINFAIMIAPNKEHIYSEYMPDTYFHSEVSRTDLLIETMRENDINVVSPKDELLKNRTNYQVYYSYDTHWNQLGAYIGVKETLETWDILIPNLSDRGISSKKLMENYHYGARDDLAVMVGLLPILDDEIEYEVNGTIAMDWKKYEKEQNGKEISYFRNEGAKKQETILLLGDSFRTAMIPALREVFSDVYVLYHTHYTPEMLNEINPDYVLVEYVERYSSGIEYIEEMLFH